MVPLRAWKACSAKARNSATRTVPLGIASLPKFATSLLSRSSGAIFFKHLVQCLAAALGDMVTAKGEFAQGARDAREPRHMNRSRSPVPLGYFQAQSSVVFRPHCDMLLQLYARGRS